MLIFTLPSWYKSEKHPENSIFIYEQMQALKDNGHQVVVLSVQPVPVQSLKRVDNDIRITDDHGIITYYKEIYVFSPSRFREIYIRTFRSALYKLIYKAMDDFGKPDVFYAHFTFAAGYAALDIAEALKVPLVIEEHYSGLMSPVLDKKLSYYLCESVNRANRFICVSDGLRKSVYSKTGTGRSIDVVSNMINPCFQYCDPIAHGRFAFFSCGSLIPRKGFDLLINAFSEEFHNEPNVILRIAGSGSEKKELSKLIEKLGMQKRIQLIGQLSREGTLEEYINCNCFVLPSRAETYGLVYREALAVGRPIVSTKHGGFGSSDWYDEYGFLIDIDNKSQLRKAMRSIYDHYDAYDFKRISQLSLNDCSATAVSENISKILTAASTSRD